MRDLPFRTGLGADVDDRRTRRRGVSRPTLPRSAGRIGSWSVVVAALAVLAVLVSPGLASSAANPTPGPTAWAPESGSTATPAVRASLAGLPVVNSTLDLTNGTLLAGNVAPTTANASATAAVYDPSSSQLFVALSTGAVLVLALPSASVVATIGVGSDPSALALDVSTSSLYVANTGSSNVSVLSTVNDSVVATVTVGTSPDALAVDPTTDSVFVANAGSDDLTVLNGSNQSLIGNVTVGSGPDGLAFDTSTGDLYVANGGSNNVSEVGGFNLTSFGSASTGTAPSAIVLDNATGTLFVTDRLSNSTTVINSSGLAVVATVAVGVGPTGLTYDFGTSEVFVANEGSGNLTVIAGANNTAVGSVSLPGDEPTGVVYDNSSATLVTENLAARTLSFVSDASYVVTATYILAADPVADAFDASTSQVDVVQSSGNALNVVDGANGTIVATVSVGAGPDSVLADPNASTVWVADAGSSNVSVVSTSTWSLVGNLSTPLPEGMAFDPSGGTIYVANALTNSVTVFDATNGSAVATISVGTWPVAVAYDAGTNEVFVANQLSANITIIDASTNTVLANPAVGTDPEGIAVGDSSVFVANTISNNVTVLSETNSTVTANVGVGTGPIGVAYDAATGEVFVADSGSGEVSVLLAANDSTIGTVAVASIPGYGPSAVTVDPSNGITYVCNPDEGTLSLLTTPTTTNGLQLNFTETGLPGGSNWSVAVDGVPTTSNGTSIAMTILNGTYGYVVGPVPGFVASPSSGSVVVNGTSVSVSVTFIAAPFGEYSLEIAETGLPYGTNWSADVNGTSSTSTGPAIVVWLPNGTYPFTIGAVSGFTASPVNGTAVIDGRAASASVTFAPSITRSVYTLSFNETGLPTGTNWSVALNGSTNWSTGGVLNFTEPNGTYGFVVTPVSGYHAVPTNGNETLAGANRSVPIDFTPVSSAGQYWVWFNESGLPAGTNWTIDLDGASVTSDTATLNFTEPNGTYDYTVPAASGYAPTPPNGTVTVDGADQVVTLVFVKVFALTFSESGLPAGTNWSVTVSPGSASAEAGGTAPLTRYSDGASVVQFEVPNGTYSYAASAPGYTTQTGSVTVSGTPVAAPAISFPISQPVSHTNNSTSAAGFPYLLLGVIVVIIIVIAIVVALLWQRRTPPTRTTVQTYRTTNADGTETEQTDEIAETTTSPLGTG